MTLLLPRRAILSAPAKAHALPWRLPAAVPLYAAATSSSSSMVSQISLPVVGYGIVTRHDGICGKEAAERGPVLVMVQWFCVGSVGSFSASKNASERHEMTAYSNSAFPPRYSRLE